MLSLPRAKALPWTANTAGMSMSLPGAAAFACRNITSGSHDVVSRSFTIRSSAFSAPLEIDLNHSGRFEYVTAPAISPLLPHRHLVAARYAEINYRRLLVQRRVKCRSTRNHYWPVATIRACMCTTAYRAPHRTSPRRPEYKNILRRNRSPN